MPRRSSVGSRIIGLVILVSIGYASIAAAVASPARLESQRLQQAAAARVSARDFVAAIPLLEQALAIDRASLGRDDPRLAQTLRMLAGVLRTQGTPPRMQSLLEEALQIATSAGDRALTAGVLGDLGAYHVATENFAAAEPVLQQALRLHRPSLDPLAQLEFERTTLMFGETLEGLGHWEDAAAVFAAGRQIAGDREIEFGCGSGRVAAHRSDSNRARVWLDACIRAAIRETFPADFVARNIAARAALETNPERAIAVHRAAIAITEKEGRAAGAILAVETFAYAKFLNSLGRNAAARDGFVRAAQMGERLDGPERVVTLAALRSAAEIERSIDDARAAAEHLKRAIALEESWHGAHTALATSLRVELADVLSDAGRFGEAEVLYQAALANGTGTVEDRSRTELHYAVLLQVQGREGEGRDHLANALKLQKSVLATAESGAGDTLDMISLAAAQHDAFDLALDAAQSGLALRKRLHGDASIEVADSLARVGQVLFKAGETARAETSLRRAIAIYEGQVEPAHAGFAGARITLAMLRASQGKGLASEESLTSAFEEGLGEAPPGDVAGTVQMLRAVRDAQERIGNEILLRSNSSDREAFQERYMLDVSTAVSLHLLQAPERADLRDLAIDSIVRGKGRVLDTQVNAYAELRNEPELEGEDLLHRLANVRAEISERRLSGATEDALSASSSRARALEAEVAFRSAAARQAADSVVAADVRAVLPPAAALVEFVQYRRFEVGQGAKPEFHEKRYGVYVMGRDRPLAWAELGEAAPIDALVVELRKSMQDPRMRAASRRLSAELYGLLLAPVEASLAAAKHWIVAPDGHLALVPFSALRDASGTLVVERVATSFIPTSRHLLREPAFVKSQSEALIVAAPDFDASAAATSIAAKRSQPASQQKLRNSYTALPETALEAQSLTDLLVGAEVLTGAQATEARVKSISRPRVLHFATHAFFDASAPAESGGSRSAAASPLARAGLVLAGANQAPQGEDGVLTALEVIGLDLSGTELVVLSACETGLGEAAPGEGVIGLQRAFAVAGARSQVMSLWKVDDVATRELMVAFYERITSGVPRVQALRQAQLALRSDASTAHPYYWAGFLLSGEWGSMSE